MRRSIASTITTTIGLWLVMLASASSISNIGRASALAAGPGIPSFWGVRRMNNHSTASAASSRRRKEAEEVVSRLIERRGGRSDEGVEGERVEEKEEKGGERGAAATTRRHCLAPSSISRSSIKCSKNARISRGVQMLIGRKKEQVRGGGGGGRRGTAAAAAAPTGITSSRGVGKSDMSIKPPTTTAAATGAGGGGGGDKVSTLWLVKLLFFLFYASLGSVMPYLPVYYHSLGIPDKEIGMLGAITPAATFFVSPLWGALADQTGRHKDILFFTFTTSVLARLAFIWKATFGWLCILVCACAVLNAPVRPLLDSSVLSLLEDKREYGKQRLWGQFGFGAAGFLVGPLLMNHKFGGYKAAFYIHAIISIPTLFIMSKFRPAKQPPRISPPFNGKRIGKNDGEKEKPRVAPHFREGLGILIRNPDACIFFLMVFVIGVSSGIIENFAYKRLREVGGEGTVMGVSRGISSVAGVPMFWFSGQVTRKLSVIGVLILSICSYIIRFFIYASIRNPWQGLPAEALRGITFAAMWSSATFYTHKISPPGLSATMLGFLNGMYGGLGQSTGALIGGGLSHKFGTPKAFIMSGCVDVVIVTLFLTYWFFHPQATKLQD